MSYHWNYWNSLRRPRWPEENGYLPGLVAGALPQRSAMPQFGTAFAPGNPRPPVQPGGLPGMLAPLAATPTIPQLVLPPSPGYGDFGLLGKGLFPEPPPSSGLLDWVGFADFLTRNRRGQEPRFAREAPRPMWQNPDGPGSAGGFAEASGLLGMFNGGHDREDTARSGTATGAPVPMATAATGKGGRMGRPAYPSAQHTFDVGPPTSEAVDVEAMMNTFRFDPNGRGEYGAAIAQTLRDPIYVGNGEVDLKARQASDLAGEAGRAMGKQFPNVRVARDNEADAFRHALWSFRMTRELGAEAAKSFGDAHEVSRPNRPGELLMDLYNNNAGRQMALDPSNRDRTPEEVILKALQDGRLQTGPFSTGQAEQADERLQRTSLGNDPDVVYVTGTPGRYGRRYGVSPVKGGRDPRRR